LGLELHVLHASTERDCDEVFANLVQLHAGALSIGPDSLFTNRQKDLAARSVRHASRTSAPIVVVGSIYPARGTALSPIMVHIVGLL
jgi:hypothetical protein